MSVERGAVVDAIDAGTVSLRLAADCRGCTGCAGRCGLIGSLRSADRVDLPSLQFAAAPQIGQNVLIRLDDRVLLRQAGFGYGLPLAGLLAMALLGHVLAGWLNLDRDLAAVLGALAGTLTGVALSKRAMPQSLRVFPADDGGPL